MNVRIKELRKNKLKMTQKEFSAKLGLSENFIWQIEKGDREPSDRTIKDICREFHVNETWLRTGIGEMQSEETHQEKLAAFFSDVLATAPDDRSAFIAALSDLPPAFWPLVVEQARSITASLKEKEKED